MAASMIELRKASLLRVWLLLKGLLSQDLRGRTRNVMSLDFTHSPELARLQRSGTLDIPGASKNKRRFHRMLARYYYALQHTSGKRVLDSCCGVGWGSYLLAHNALEVVGVDVLDEAIKFATKHWNSSRLCFAVQDVLALKVPGEKFDVAIGMESIEHFSNADGAIYISNLANSLKPDGKMILSSYFADSRKEAEKVCLNVKDHLYIWTKKEISEQLKKRFNYIKFVDDSYLVAFS